MAAGRRRLLEPYVSKGFPIQNRIFVPPMVMYTWGEDTGCITERHIAHYRAMAQGGAGLVIQEDAAVSRECMWETQPGRCPGRIRLERQRELGSGGGFYVPSPGTG